MSRLYSNNKGGLPSESKEWFASLTEDQKRDYVKQYTGLRDSDSSKLPDMRDLSIVRLWKFSEKDIWCLFRFKDKYK